MHGFPAISARLYTELTPNMHRKLGKMNRRALCYRASVARRRYYGPKRA
jgi:hypothetical protein